MKRFVAVLLVTGWVLVLGLNTALAADVGTKDEATAMVKKAVGFIKANGADKAYAEFSNPKGQFVDRDLYIAVYDMTGKCLAHGANAEDDRPRPHRQQGCRRQGVRERAGRDDEEAAVRLAGLQVPQPDRPTRSSPSPCTSNASTMSSWAAGFTRSNFKTTTGPPPALGGGMIRKAACSDEIVVRCFPAKGNHP